MNLTSLNFWKVYRVTFVRNGTDVEALVGMGVKQQATPLNDGRMGVSLLWRTNGPYEHCDRRVVGEIMRDEDGVVEIRSEEDENFAVTIFEMLTLETWKAMRKVISDYDSLAPQFQTDEDLRQWYWHQFVGDSWTEDQPIQT